MRARRPHIWSFEPDQRHLTIESTSANCQPTPFLSILQPDSSLFMSTEEEQTIALERKRRSTKKGIITRIKSALQTHQACPPEAYSIAVIEELRSDLKSHIRDYHNLCDSITAYIADHPDLEGDDEAITERHEEEFQAIRNQLTSLLEARKLWAECQTLCIEMAEELEDPNPASTSFRKIASQLTSRAAHLVASARTHVRAISELEKTVGDLQEKSKKLKTILRGTDVPTTASAAVPVTPAAKTSHSHASLKISTLL